MLSIYLRQKANVEYGQTESQIVQDGPQKPTSTIKESQQERLEATNHTSFPNQPKQTDHETFIKTPARNACQKNHHLHHRSITLSDPNASMCIDQQ
jgi:hypothetical protein